MNKPLKRTLFAYRLHGHLKGKAVQDYHALFQSVERIPPQNRAERINDRAIALPRIEIEGDCVTLTAYEGEIDLHPLLYDLESTNERTGTLRKNEVVATRTHIIIDLQTRHVVAEYNHRDAKALDVVDLIASLARRNSVYGGLTLELPPIAAEGFLEELRKFERVRVASIELVRPNFNWDDCEDALGKFAGDSNAARIGVTFTAQQIAWHYRNDQGAVPTQAACDQESSHRGN